MVLHQCLPARKPCGVNLPMVGTKQRTVARWRKPNPKTLAEIIRRIVEVARPEKIILFGSAARGRMGPNSDIDLLVIKGGKFHRDRLTKLIYAGLYGVGEAVDVVVVTPED